MWHHCIVCSSDLGENQDLEEFAVGRRLAFDPAKGRLWVVCPRCERWNLVPFDERWEAIEALEKAYRDTSSRFSTPEIGLARLGGGLEIVRIGDPVPGEFAAWRWGSRFGRRKRRLKSLVQRGSLPKLEKSTAWAAGVALAPLAPVLAPLAVISIPLILLARMESNWHVAKGSPAGVGKMQLKSGGITPSGIFPGWSIHIQAWTQVAGHGGYTHIIQWKEYSGDDALHLARRALPLLNRRTPKLTTISDAVGEISGHGGVEGYLSHAAALKPKWVPFRHYPKPVLMAMEMALFEDEERRALEGELEHLLEAWREAEEIAEISDNLIEPRGWEAFRARAVAASEAASGGEPLTVGGAGPVADGGDGGSEPSNPKSSG